MLGEDAVQSRTEASKILFDELSTLLRESTKSKDYEGAAMVGKTLSEAITQSQQVEMMDGLTDEAKKMARKTVKKLDLGDLD